MNNYRVSANEMPVQKFHFVVCTHHKKVFTLAMYCFLEAQIQAFQVLKQVKPFQFLS